jgi:hypothetical protein
MDNESQKENTASRGFPWITASYGVKLKNSTQIRYS